MFTEVSEECNIYIIRIYDKAKQAAILLVWFSVVSGD
jgi:hypothetical protein